MIFDSADPFPLLDETMVSYHQAKEHADAADRWLGLNVDETEEIIQSTSPRQYPHQQLWIGLPPQSLQTPYIEIRQIIERLQPRPADCLIDLGAAYGRMAHVVGWHYPQIRFVGYELVHERVEAARKSLARFNYPNVEIVEVDLFRPDFTPESADFYFLYDFGARAAIEKTLNDLKVIALERPVTVVGRGRSSRDTIEKSHPWLSQVVPSVHYAHYSIYRSALRE